MPEERRGCGCGCGGNSSFLGGVFGEERRDGIILVFIIIFLLLFTDFGCFR